MMVVISHLDYNTLLASAGLKTNYKKISRMVTSALCIVQCKHDELLVSYIT